MNTTTAARNANEPVPMIPTAIETKGEIGSIRYRANCYGPLFQLTFGYDRTRSGMPRGARRRSRSFSSHPGEGHKAKGWDVVAVDGGPNG